MGTETRESTGEKDLKYIGTDEGGSSLSGVLKWGEAGGEYKPDLFYKLMSSVLMCTISGLLVNLIQGKGLRVRMLDLFLRLCQ